MEQVARFLGEPTRMLETEQTYAWLMQQLGQPTAALDWMVRTIRSAKDLGPAFKDSLTAVSYDYASILIDLGDVLGAARVLGAADADRERAGWERRQSEINDLAPNLARAQQMVTRDQWDRAYAEGRQTALRTVVDALLRSTGSSLGPATVR
jgi:hypothetical protein